MIPVMHRICSNYFSRILIMSSVYIKLRNFITAYPDEMAWHLENLCAGILTRKLSRVRFTRQSRCMECTLLDSLYSLRRDCFYHQHVHTVRKAFLLPLPPHGYPNWSSLKNSVFSFPRSCVTTIKLKIFQFALSPSTTLRRILSKGEWQNPTLRN